MGSRRELANAVRFLSVDAVERAKSGHPGAPMGMADFVEVLWNDFLKHNPKNPDWPDRDRFVLSNGHGSMLLYSLLHLSGYDLKIEDIKNFRKLGSRTAGHPEYRLTPGVETTTGPLGQGVCNAVGMALAEKLLAEKFNRDGHAIVDHHTYVVLGDGCMMEGVSHEACSLAGTLGLGKLIALYDDNGISIDGQVQGWFGDDTPARFEAYGWHVVRSVDGHDGEAVKKALEQARGAADKPSLVCLKTVIGYGADKKSGTASCHGSPLGGEEIAKARAKLGWPWPPFEIPQDISEAWNAVGKGEKAEAAWRERFEKYAAAYPELAAEFERRMSGRFPQGWDEACRALINDTLAKKENLATRKSSQAAINGFGPLLPELLGGSADLSGSNGTKWSGSKGLSRDDWDANYIYYGVREFGMSAIMNGAALHRGFIPYGGTFLVFSDYARNAIRMAALMGVRAIWVLTHDSIGVGEDGPTHQPVEHAASLRLIPNLWTWRPCDALESLIAWKRSLERENGPSALCLTRQTLPFMERSPEAAANVEKGGYVLRDAADPAALIIASGSEVALAVEAAEVLEKKGKAVRVVSMPCVELFDEQDQGYKDSVLPPKVAARLAVEAGTADGWWKYVGLSGRVLGMSGFGESAPGPELFKHFGFTAERAVALIEEML